MLAGIPTVSREMLLTEFERLVLERRREGVIPTIEKAEHRNDADDLDHLLVAPVLAQLHEHLVGHCIRHAAGRDSNVQRGTLRRVEEWAGLVDPDRIQLLLVYAELRRPCR